MGCSWSRLSIHSILLDWSLKQEDDLALDALCCSNLSRQVKLVERIEIYSLSHLNNTSRLKTKSAFDLCNDIAIFASAVTIVPHVLLPYVFIRPADLQAIFQSNRHPRFCLDSDCVLVSVGGLRYQSRPEYRVHTHCTVQCTPVHSPPVQQPVYSKGGRQSPVSHLLPATQQVHLTCNPTTESALRTKMP